MAEWSTEVQRGWSALGELSDWWNQQPAVKEIPFLHSRMLECWGRAFMKTQEQFHVHVLKRNGEVVAAIPLIHRPGRVYSLSQDQVHRTDVVSIPDEEVLERIPDWLNRLPVVHLHCFQEGSPLVRSLPQYPRWVLRATRHSPYLELTGGVEGARAKLGSKSQSTLRRRWRRIREVGEVEFLDHPEADDVQAALENGFALEASGWKAKSGRAVLTTPEYERFYRGVAEVAEDEGWLRLGSLNLDGRMVAFHFNLVYGNRRHLMVTAFDESAELSNFSVGTLLLDAVVERSCEEGLLSYELGRGWGQWKQRWTSTAHTIYSFSIYGSGIRGGLMSSIHKLRASKPN